MMDHACPVCGAGFTTEFSLDDHCWDAHGVCHHCGTEFEERGSLYAHWLMAHEDRLSGKDRARAESEAGEPTFGDRLSHQGPVDAITNARPSRRTVLLGGLVGLGGVVGATLLGAGCAACGSAVLAGLLSTVGASGLLLALPLDGLEFSVLAMLALLLSLYWLAEGMRGGEIGSRPVEV